MLASAGRPRVRFGAFVLDTARGMLLDADGRPVPLRPKAWAMLNHLVVHAGHVVEREALLDAVWPDVTVTDDSVTQCVAELRRALGEQGPKWLRTVPRRGYIFDVELVRDEPAPAPADPAAIADTIAPALVAPMRPPMAPAPAAGGQTSMRKRMGATVAIGGTVLAAAALALLLWPAAPRPVPAPPPEPASAQSTAQPPSEAPRDRARRLYREGVAITESAQDAGGHWLDARAAFLKAIEADPEWAPPYMWAIFTHTNMVNGGFSADPEADLRAAEHHLDRLSALQPEAWQTWNARGAVRRLQRRHADALAAYQRVVELSPGTLPARANAGLMLVLLGRAEEAIEPIRATIAMATPDHLFMPYWNACLGLALLHAAADDYGVEAFRRAQGDTALVPGALRDVHLAAALALSGDTVAAAAVLADLRQRGAEPSEEAIRASAMSGDPGYLAQRETLFRGLALARQQ